DVDARLAARGAGEEELLRDRALARPRAAEHGGEAPLEHAAAEDRVEAGDARREPPREVDRRCRRAGSEPRAAAGLDADPARADRHRVPAALVRAVPKLVDLE